MAPACCLLVALLCPPAALPASAAPQVPERKEEAGKPREGKPKQAETCLAIGTVFTAAGFALPGAEIRVRRQGERKVRWRAQTDRRGEFAVRVPRGAEYVLEVVARGFTAVEHKLDAREADRQDLVFRLQPDAKGGSK
jgi:hypothetical protein